MTSSDTQNGPEMLSAEYWARTWHDLQQEGLFRDSQKNHPGRWRSFYDQMAPLWEEMTGGGQPAAQAICEALASQGLLAQGSTVLEVGCGSGSLALVMAQREARVTALDDSSGMLEILQERARELPTNRILPVNDDWQAYEPKHPHDVAIAAFFPPVMKPAGLERLESLARKTCALVVGTGHEAIPLRRALWEKIMDQPLPDISFQMPCALGYLLASGRRPDLKHLSWRADLNLPKEHASHFYENYFALFGKTGPEVRQHIDTVLKTYAAAGRVKLAGEASATLITWPTKGREQ
jgi:SAM-dependent methyltransferase